MIVTRCSGEGQGSCRRCEANGKWNRMWMPFLYHVDGMNGCYCRECVKEIERYRAICDAININPYGWQTDYVINGAKNMPHHRFSGKTTAVMVKTLMASPKDAKELCDMLCADPDFRSPIIQMVWHYNHYISLAKMCNHAGIDVVIDISHNDFINQMN